MAVHGQSWYFADLLSPVLHLSVVYRTSEWLRRIQSETMHLIRLLCVCVGIQNVSTGLGSLCTLGTLDIKNIVSCGKDNLENVEVRQSFRTRRGLKDQRIRNFIQPKS